MVDYDIYFQSTILHIYYHRTRIEKEAGGEGGRGSDSQQRRLVSERWQQLEEPYSWSTNSGRAREI